MKENVLNVVVSWIELYVLKGSLQAFRQDYDLKVLHHLYMLGELILCTSGTTFSLKSTSNNKFLEKLCMTILFTLHIFRQKSAERE